MKYRGHTVCIIDEDTNLEDIHDIQNKTEKSLLIYVPLCGVNDIYLPRKIYHRKFRCVSAEPLCLGGTLHPTGTGRTYVQNDR